MNFERHGLIESKISKDFHPKWDDLEESLGTNLDNIYIYLDESLTKC